MTADKIASLIGHTLLKPEATAEQIHNLCKEARQFKFASVCVNPWYVALAVKLMRGSGIRICTVAGFPLGATSTPAKVFEARQGIRDGAREIDMVMNVGALKSGDHRAVQAEIRAVADTCHRAKAICKVILENVLLADVEKIRACKLAKKAGADYVKTSTGFNTAGATAADVALMRATVGPKMGVKASGGIRSYEDLMKMVEAGATRIGTSSGVKIMEEAARIHA